MKKCIDCGLYDKARGGCVRTQTLESPDGYCAHWTKEVFNCSICGSPFIRPVSYIVVGEELKAVCPNCFSHRGTCALCKSNGYCAFKEDPIDLPHMVTKTVRQGNAVIQTQIPNPERVKATCAAKCPCYSPEGCNREFGTCGKYAFIMEN